MRKLPLSLLMGSAACFAAALITAQEMSVARTRIEHGTDVDAAKISLKPTVISVEDLLTLRDKVGAGMDFAKFHDRRFSPFETTVYRITGTLKSIKIDKEGDINFIVRGKTGSQAVIEIPEPEDCKGSMFRKEMEMVRNALELRYHPKAEPKSLDETVTVDGIGFFGSRRKAGNHPFGETVRMMPAIRVEFSKS